MSSAKRAFVALVGVFLIFVTVPSGQAANCISDGELEAAVGDQVRSGAFAIDTGKLGDRPMCSGLLVATAIQALAEKYLPSPRPAPVPVPAKASPAALRIPDQFLGRWERTVRDCDREPGEEGFVVEATGILYYETRDDLRRIAVNSPTDITIDITGEYGPDRWRETHRINLLDGGRRITFAGSGKVYVRCPS